MIAIIGTVVCSTLIFVIFRIFERYNIHTFQAIIINYLTAFLCGYLIHFKEDSKEVFVHLEWLPFVGFSALLFISLFLLMAISSQKNGIAATSVAVKMSMAVSMIGMILLYNEEVSYPKVIGIILALVGVYLIAAPGLSGTKKTSAYMLIVLFVGSGLLDLNLNYAQNHVLNHISSSLFTAFGFGAAFSIGIVVYLIQIIRAKAAPFHYKNANAGILLGIPNYYSIYFLLESYNAISWNDSSILALVNVSVVILSVLTGLLAYKEVLNSKKIVGIVASILAILMLYISS